MKLEHMFYLQNELQEKLKTWDKIENDSDKQQFINQNILAMYEEVTEILKETAYKNPDVVKFGWKKNQTFNNDKFKDEIIDLWHFMINLCLVAGMSSEEFYTRYCNKRKINIERNKTGY